MRKTLWLLFLGAAVPGAAQDAVTLVSVSGYANFHAGGVVATISGDLNGNASAALEWRAAGGGSFQAAHPLARIDATHFVGSLFALNPATAYEARVTLGDPDGVTGPPSAVAAFATRVDSMPEPTLRTLYVSPTGNDANPGTSPGAPLRTVQRSADLAQAGDLVLIAPGVYRERVSVPRSGTASQPIVFRGSAPGAVLDGADAAVAAGVSWTAAGGGVFTRVLGFATGHVVSELGRLYRYGSVAALQALGAGAPGGFYFDGTTLHVKFANGSSPASHVMQVARLEEGFFIDGRAFVRVESLEIRHYGAGDFGKGVYLRNAADSAVRRCRIHEVESAGIWVKGGDRHVLEDNEIWDTSIFGWPWSFTKSSSAEDDGILFTDDVGRGHVVRRNTIHGTFNGMGPCGSLPPPGGAVSNEVDLYDNVLFQHTDDGFEPEGYCSNYRIWNNRISDVHMAVAIAPAAPGPLFIVRNVAWRFGNTRTSQLDGFTASAIKINSDLPIPIGPVFVYHNTFLTDAPNTDALAFLNESGPSTFMRARNNVIAGTRYAFYKPNPIVWDGNGNDLYTTDATRLVYWQGTRYNTLAAYRAALGQEAQGLSAPPQLLSPASGIFAPLATSPLVDAGLLVPGINDDYAGSAPDVGAVEWLGPPPPLAFYTVQPCRVVDTRVTGQGPALAAGESRTFAVAGVCGIPAGAKAVSMNVAVTQPGSAGNLRLFAAGSPAPVVSALNYGTSQTRGNNAIAPLGGDGRLGVRAVQSVGGVHVILDVNGYFQ
jgi:hypothetical protein